MNWKDRIVLITGAGGFIGSHLAERLVREGAQVHAFVRYTSRNDIGMLRYLPGEIAPSIKIIYGDLRDQDAVRQVVRGMDTVFHLGASIAIPYSYEHPQEVVETNVIGTFNVLLAVREFGCRRLIHTSSSEVYGSALYVPIDEGHPLQGQSPYSASKIGADKLVESFNCTYGLPVVTLRPFNTFGPRQSARAIIPTIISQILTRDEIQLGSLIPTRDFTFVTDTVEGFILAGSSENVIGQVINLGNGEMISIGELVEMIGTILGKLPNVFNETQRVRPVTSEVMRLQASILKAENLLGWSPRVSLKQGLQLTCEWIKGNLDIFNPETYTI